MSWLPNRAVKSSGRSQTARVVTGEMPKQRLWEGEDSSGSPAVTWDCPTGAGLQIGIPRGFPGEAGGGRAEVWDHTHLENQKQSGTLTNSRCGGGVGRSITFKTLCHY